MVAVDVYDHVSGMLVLVSAGMTLSETQKLSTGPTFPVFRMSSPGDKIHCSAMW